MFRNTQVYICNVHEYRKMLRNAWVQLGMFRNAHEYSGFTEEHAREADGTRFWLISSLAMYLRIRKYLGMFRNVYKDL